MIMKKRKKAGFLTENVIFLVLNLIVITILLLFIYSRTGGIILYEETYAKNIALLIDSAKPGTEFYLNMENALEEAEDNAWDVKKTVKINNKRNMVTVQLSEDSGYSYSFFNDLKVVSRFDNRKEPLGGQKGFIFAITNEVNEEGLS
ncbi:hypothetical protein GF378_01795 [Candidatus Pacearchaeota archaeon]|nr:hypothetical protein [Candidatus Pacearchaeota archaeon]